MANIIIAQRLTEHDYGILSYSLAVILVIVPFADGGLRVFGWKTIALSNNKMEDIAQSVFKAKICLGMCVFVATVFLGAIIFRDMMTKLMIALFALSLLVNQTTIDWIYRGLDRTKDVVFIYSASGILFLIFVVATPYPFSPYSYPLALFLSNLIPILWLLRPKNEIAVYLKNWEEHKTKLLTTIWDSRHYLSVGLASKFFPNYPIIILGLYTTPNVIAKFRYAHLFYVFGVSMSIHLAGTYFTKTTKFYLQSKVCAANAIFKIGISVFVIVTVMIALLFYPVHIVINKLFHGGDVTSTYLTMFLLIMPFGFVNGFLREIMPSIDSGKRTSLFIFSSLAIGIIVAIIMVKFMGISGVFLGIFTGECIGCFFGLLLLLKIKIKMAK